VFDLLFPVFVPLTLSIEQGFRLYPQFTRAYIFSCILAPRQWITMGLNPPS
jgi:hypothetical protein